jgi:hypothetical protein
VGLKVYNDKKYNEKAHFKEVPMFFNKIAYPLPLLQWPYQVTSCYILDFFCNQSIIYDDDDG